MMLLLLHCLDLTIPIESLLSLYYRWLFHRHLSFIDSVNEFRVLLNMFYLLLHVFQ
jgi:hypothetical protein